MKNSKRRSHVHLQTSCSSEEDDDGGPPRSRPRPEFRQPITSGSTPRRLATVTGDAVPLREATNKPTKSLRTPTHSEKENSQGVTRIEKALLETNQLLKHVIRRVDKCEKQIKSFENKFDEVTTCSSSVSIPLRKKAIVPEEVRVSFVVHTSNAMYM